MKTAAAPLACVRRVVSSLLVLMGLSFAPWIKAQSSTSSIKQLFAFSCDSTTQVCSQGDEPNTLIQSANGDFYGTTEFGGSGKQAAGTVFELTPAGKLTVLYNFVANESGNYPDGANPTSLVEGDDGFLYGTAEAGGANNQGVVFRLSKTGEFQILNDSVGGPTTLVLGGDGNLYGGTFGTNSVGGSLFRITPSGAYTLLHALNPTVEGPMAIGLTLASDGNLYGTTLGGEELLTTLFRLTPAGQFTTLQTFHYGQFPVSAPVEAGNGKLYGGLSRFEDQAAVGLFASNFSGNDFEQILLPSLLFGEPLLYLTPASDANLWGLTFPFGEDQNGSVVAVSPNGTQVQRILFNGTNGSLPGAALVQASDGRFFGVTLLGGSVQQGETASGVIFVLDAGLAAPKPLFVSFDPPSGAAGSQVIIHGTHLIGTTAVTFNRVSAMFRVLNAGNIEATVPAGASTGPIAVTNMGGEAVSEHNYTLQ